jgi:hypothetical protein
MVYRADLACVSTGRPSAPSSPPSRTAPVRVPLIVAVTALALAGCNANQAVNPSGQANLANVYPNYSPYNPIQYAQTSGFYGGR